MKELHWNQQNNEIIKEHFSIQNTKFVIQVTILKWAVLVKLIIYNVHVRERSGIRCIYGHPWDIHGWIVSMARTVIGERLPIIRS